MSISQPNPSPILLQRLIEAGAFADHPLTLIDVGCAYGIDAHWRQFPLRVRAIDPIVEEVERLKAQEADPHVEYVAGFIRKPGFPAIAERELGTDNHFMRSSAYAVGRNVSYNEWQVQTLSDHSLTLDQLAAGLGRVDFLKIDTDGSDIEVLHSGPLTLQTALGVSVETVFAGSLHPMSNSRSNIDTLLRGHGFSLYDEEIYRYSRAVLPDEFTWGVAGITRRGQATWSQSLYLRDLVPNGEGWPDEAFLKMAGLFEIYGLNDCAAELIVARPSAFEPFINPTEALDLLTREWWPEYGSYADLMAQFEEDYTQFFRLPEWRKPKPATDDPAPDQEPDPVEGDVSSSDPNSG